MRHGPHHAAQKSTSTGTSRDFSRTPWGKSAVVTSAIWGESDMAVFYWGCRVRISSRCAGACGSANGLVVLPEPFKQRNFTAKAQRAQRTFVKIHIFLFLSFAFFASLRSIFPYRRGDSGSRCRATDGGHGG